MSDWRECDYGIYPNTWELLPLNDISTLITDGAHASPKPVSIGKMMCSVKDMTYNKFDFSNVKNISENDYLALVNQGCKPQIGDLLISKDGANCLDILFVNKQKEDFVLLSSIAIVRLQKKAIPEYVRYFLLSPATQFILKTNFVSGSAIPRVVIKDFRKVDILLPPLPEQRAIAAVLSSLDDKIDLLHRQNKTLEAMAETLFRQWFVEEADEGWEEGTISDLFELQRGYDLPVQDRVEGTIPIVSSSGISGTHCDSRVKGPGVITGRSGLIGGVYYVTEDFWPLNTALYIKNYKAATPIYSYFYLKQLDLNGYNAGSSVPTLNRNHVHSESTIVPPKELIAEFSNCVLPFFSKLNRNQTQIRTLEKLRDTLLPKLMNGEVRVEI